MQMWDITLRLREGSSTWPGEGRALRQRRISSRNNGAQANTTAYDGSVHLGTHVDAPLHFVDDGACVADLDPGLFFGPARVVELKTTEQITREDLTQNLSDSWPTRVLFKTRNSAPGGALDAVDFDTSYCAVTRGAAQLLVEHEVRLVGIDAYSVAPFDDLRSTHEVLLGAGIPVLEGLDLRSVSPGDYTLIALPLRLVGFEGSPIRAMLVRDDPGIGPLNSLEDR
jgi:arylformamidase